MRHAHEARAQEGVRRRAMDHGRAHLLEPRAFAIRKMDAVREEAAAGEKTEMVVDVGVVLGFREKPLDEIYLAHAFGEVRLHERSGEGVEELPRERELPLRRG